MLAWNLGNLVFFVLAGRLIGPDEYGLLAALLAATMVALVPAGALQTGVVRAEAGLVLVDPAGAGAIYRHALTRAIVWVPCVTGALVVAGLVVGASSGAPTGPLVLTVAVVAPIPFLFLALGQLQAERRFNGFSASFSLIGVPRPILLLPLLVVLPGVYAGLTASAIAMASAALLALALTVPRLRRAGRPPADGRGAFSRSLAPLAVGLSGVALLANVDIVVAEVALPDGDAGRFAAVAVLGKAVVLLPQAVTVAVLPRVAARRAAGHETGPLLALAVLVTLVGGLIAAGIAWLVAGPFIRATFGGEFSAAADFLGPITLVSTLLGVIIVLVNHHAGRGGDPFLWVVGGLALLFPLLFVPFHSSGWELIGADAIGYAVVLIAHEVVYGRGPDGIVRGLWLLARRRSLGDGQVLSEPSAPAGSGSV